MKKKTILILGTIVLFIIVGCSVLSVGIVSNARVQTMFNNLETKPAKGPASALATDLNVLAPLAPLPTAVPDQIIARADAEEQLLINLYERVNPSVVNILVLIGEEENADDPSSVPAPEDFSPFFNPQGQGSGFVYDKEGHIVTNNHVVEGAVRIYVTFYDGTQLSAEVVGEDLDSDLAVIKVDAPADGLLPVEWGDSEQLQVGQRAATIGNPFGLDGTLTSGIISAKGRSLPSLNPAFRIPEIIQTDAAVNPGNSGGPLLNSEGEVVGVISAIVPRQMGAGERSFLGVGFAIPGNLAKRVIPQLIAGGAYSHPWIGVIGNSLTSEIAEEMNLDMTQQGALIIQVLPGGPASDARLRGGDREFANQIGITQVGGDVIIGIEDEEVTEFNDLISFLSRRASVGDTIELTIIRDGKTMKIDLTLEARPGQDELFRP